MLFYFTISTLIPGAMSILKILREVKKETLLHVFLMVREI